MLQAALGEWRQRFAQNVCGASIADSVSLLVRRGTTSNRLRDVKFKSYEKFYFRDSFMTLRLLESLGPASDGLQRLQGSRLYRSLDRNLAQGIKVDR